jgi:hypothetical protein
MLSTYGFHAAEHDEHCGFDKLSPNGFWGFSDPNESSFSLRPSYWAYRLELNRRV